MEEIIRLKLLLRNAVLCLLLFCPQVYSASVSTIQSQNPGFWQARDESASSSQAKSSADEAGRKQMAQSDQYYQKMAWQLKQRAERIAFEVRKHWSSVELSGKSKWVEYGNSWQSKRVVDYAGNEIRVSALKPMTTLELKEFAGAELKELLGSTVSAALRRDPVLKHTYDATDENGLDELVFSELFKTDKPTNKDIARLAQQLMTRAYTRYQDQVAMRGDSAGPSFSLSKTSTYVVPLPKSRMRNKARQYLPLVKKYSNEFQIPADVMMAIMHTESHFNPLARSHVPAFGLMQIVPRSAGRDASRVIFSKKKLLSAGFLYKPENNIKVGAAYLNVLSFRYLKKIENPVSRLYCMVAAYNTGSANVARAFTPVPKMQKAVSVINGMSNQQVLMRLIKYLPQRETKEYVEKVLKRRKLYSRA